MSTTWMFYRKTKTGIYAKFQVTTAKEAERCRQAMIAEFGEDGTEIRLNGTTIPVNEPIK